KRIIPCLDVKAGRVVKGVKFLELRDAGDPVEIAQVYDRQGADELCFLDITASHENREIILEVVARTADQVFMPLTVGGGTNKLDDIRKLLNGGADKVSINTGDVNRPEFVREAAERFGSQCIVVAIDAKRVDNHWEVFTHGGRNPTGLDASDWAARMEQSGAGEILLTSMDRDGTKAGYDLELTRAISDRVGSRLTPRGGVEISNTSTTASPEGTPVPLSRRLSFTIRNTPSPSARPICTVAAYQCACRHRIMHRTSKRT